jgi:hypothetical protein
VLKTGTYRNTSAPIKHTGKLHAVALFSHFNVEHFSASGKKEAAVSQQFAAHVVKRGWSTTNWPDRVALIRGGGGSAN